MTALRPGKTPLAPGDFVAIENLLGKYQWLVDEADCDGWAALFMEDGVFDSAFTGQYRGHARLREVPAATRDMFQNKMRHQMGSLQMEYGADSDEVFVRYYNLVTTWMRDEGAKFFCMALYSTHLVRTGGEWKIKVASTKVI